MAKRVSKVVVSAKKAGNKVEVMYEDATVANQVEQSMSALTKAFISIDKWDDKDES